MIKAGLIVGAVALVLAAIAGFITPCIEPCVGIFAGLVAGYLAGVFQKPALSPEATKLGASAGAIAGGVSVVGSLIIGLINGLTVKPENLAAMYELLGIQAATVDETSILAIQLVTGCCMGLLNVALGAGLGAAGGAIWYKMTGSKLQQPPAQQPPLVPPAY